MKENFDKEHCQKEHYQKLFCALPRRNVAGATLRLDKITPKVDQHKQKISMLSVLFRLCQWVIAAIVYFVKGWFDYRRKEDPLRAKGRRLRKLFESLGATGIKIGQQMSIRLDLLPPVFCEELGKLIDSVPPMPLEIAIERIEAATGEKIADSFSDFDGKPIGSASVACVYRATLPNGKQVVIKVQRPEVKKQFNSDLKVIDWLTQIMELFGAVRPHFFKNFRIEFRTMLLEELDFSKEACSQRLFRKAVKRDQLHWVSAPKVISHLSTSELLVCEFVEGISCADLLAAKTTNNTELLRKYSDFGIDAKIIGERLVTLGLWGQREALFFHADPHPGNIILQPDNNIVMIDFGATGTISKQHHSTLSMMTKATMMRDSYLFGDSTLLMSGPFPNINFSRFYEQTQEAMLKFFRHFDDKQSPWWMRTTAWIWIEFLAAVREHQIPMNLDVLRMIRATLLYETLGARLHPEINLSVIDKYQQNFLRRIPGKILSESKTMPSVGFYKSEKLFAMLQGGWEYMDELSNHIPIASFSSLTKSVYFWYKMTYFVYLSGLITTIVLFFQLGQHLFYYNNLFSFDLIQSVQQLFQEPLYLSILFFLLILTFRNIVRRFSGPEN